MVLADMSLSVDEVLRRLDERAAEMVLQGESYSPHSLEESVESPEMKTSESISSGQEKSENMEESTAGVLSLTEICAS